MATDDRKKKKPGEPGYEAPGHAAGTAVRQGLSDIPSNTLRTAARFAAPVLRNVANASNFAAGVAGREPVFSAPAPVRPPVAASPSTPAVAGGGGSAGMGPAARAPARQVANPAVRVPQAGASAPGGGVLSQPRTYVNDAGQPAVVPAELARSVVNGTPTYTNAGAPAASAARSVPVAMPQFAQQAAQAAPVSQQVTMPRPPVADAYNTRQAAEQRQKLLADIDSMQFQLRGKATRSARGAMADLAQVQAGLVNTAGAQAIDVAGGDRDAALKQNLTGFEQQSATQRTGMEQAGALQRTGIEQEGANYRTGIETNRPSYVTDADGNYLSISGGTAAPVNRSDGTMVRMPRAAAEGQLTPQAILESLDKQYEIESATAGDTASTPEARELASQRLLQIDQQRQSLLGGQSGPKPPAAGAVVKGYRFKGGDPSVPANWEKVQ